MSSLRWLVLPLAMLPGERVSACLSDGDMALFGQMSAVRKRPASWQIGANDPWRTDNGYTDLVVKYSNRCLLVDEQIRLNVALYGLTYYPVRDGGAFEQDDHRARLLFDRLSLTYNLSDTVRLEAGKISNKGGLFYLKSPANLLSNYSGGFKSTRIYHPALNQVWAESSWGFELSETSENNSLSLTIVPKLAQAGKTYESSGNWSATQRSNSRDRYLLTYTDYRFADHTPSASLMFGDANAIALANSYNLSQQLTFNSELALHSKQRWRHLDEAKAEQLQNYVFPDALYHTREKQGWELALGVQYTTERFNHFGIGYYFQSEGYSARQWKKQTDVINFLSQKTPYPSLERAFDAYKYLMASEIYNASSSGNLLGKHYINSYATILLNEQDRLQPWSAINLMDKSSMTGITYIRQLKSLNNQMEVYTGVYIMAGKNNSEFGLFGETLATYIGFNYTF
ncbi:MAG: hypothetical protein QM578_26775 [Pantoea sp.]|uniref:hypothetical protein n=1 Tax=Pantoea sp. TaxID=69393 RepID=UPI0039E3FD02